MIDTSDQDTTYKRQSRVNLVIECSYYIMGVNAFKRNGYFFYRILFFQTSLFDANQLGKENGALPIILDEFKRADMICFVEIEHVYFKSW